ncbi:TPA: ATP-dependent helicase [Candidatus Woesearchaeota archaeon]|nr:ATP-dependent helicase [Candidatus Woesearchaeota archaeon]
MVVQFKQKPETDEELFQLLHPLVRLWFEEKFKGFAPPQKYAVMEVHSRNNVLVSAPTGSGKTLTAFLSILNELIDSSRKGILQDRVYAVYVSPLKALSSDVSHNLLTPLKEIEDLAKKPFGIRVGLRTGDTTNSERAKMTKKPPHILITTPESLAILLNAPKFREHLRNVEWLVVDEVHALAENKRGVHLSLTMERLARLCPHFTRVGLSATISPLEEIARYLVGYEGGKPRPCKIVDVQFLKGLDLQVRSPVNDLIDIEHGTMHVAMYDMIDALIQEHKSTLIFTNTRAATERVVHHLKERFPSHYTETIEEAEEKKERTEENSQAKAIGAHHGSLSKEHRLFIEERLRKGELKCVVCSTSLELGIDIGYIDLVILLGSPKSVARALQRCGRSGHKLHATAKGRVIVLDRDDLVECAVLLKSAMEHKIDTTHIPTNCLDVLAQQIYGMAIAEQMHINDIYNLIQQSYCYHALERKQFRSVIDYLSGQFASLEDRHVYAKIWHDEDTGMIGKKGKMARVMYMTNIGTIAEEVAVRVKVGTQTVGSIDEAFLEKLRPGDIFVLGGEVYQFKFAKGMVAQVGASVNRPPTVPSWFSDMLPLSFDLALEIGRFRKLMSEKLCAGIAKSDIMAFIKRHLYLDDNAALSIHNYFYEQFHFAEIPSHSRIIVEHFSDRSGKYAFFHTLYGRRVNDCLSRAVAYAIARTQGRDVEIGMNDNGFFLRSNSKVNPVEAFRLLKAKDLRKVMEIAIDRTEVLRRRFRHCAARSLMILRSYKGREKRVGRQQVSSQILLNAVRRLGEDFPILAEAKREVLEDLMDIENAAKVLLGIEEKKILIGEIQTNTPSPFALNLFAQGITDVFRIEDKIEFLRRMHQQVLAQIALDQKRKKLEGDSEMADYLTSTAQSLEQRKQNRSERLKAMIWGMKDVPLFMQQEMIRIVDGKRMNIRQDFIDEFLDKRLEYYLKWPKELVEFLEGAMGEAK